MKNTIGEKYITNHILSNYGELRHDPNKLIFAVRQVSKKFKLNKVDLFHYIIERKDSICGATSYGFDTRFGRELRENFKYYYYKR